MSTMKTLFKALVAIFLVAAPAMYAWADGLKGLETFIQTAQSGRADFTQVVTAPPKNGEAARSKTSSGTFAFLRPNRFSFQYKKPFEQSIVADGQTLWLYDADLNQVTQRKQADALGSTPAALIASAPNLAALQKDFSLQAAPDKDGLKWVQATPKAKDGQLQSVRIGLRGERSDQLAVLEIQDSFGQRSVLSFSRLEINPSLPAETFQFKPPAGVDVLKP